MRASLLLSILSLSLLIAPAATATKKKKKKKAPVPSSLYKMCGGIAKKDTKKLSWLYQATGEASLTYSSSPQHHAACWMLKQDRRKPSNPEAFLQRYALATLYVTSTQGNTTQWDWSTTPLKKSNWMHRKTHECSWYGVHCDWKKRVIQLDLGFMKLDGILPRELGLLTRVKDIDFHGNDFQGVLPHKMLNALTSLEYLRLHMNGFFGAIHREIQGLVNLKELHLFGNYMGGTIPTELAALSKLQVLDLYANQLSGTVPRQLASLRNLEYLDLHDNNLVGSVPREICDMKLKSLITDCLGPRPEVECSCCTVCCRGLPEFKCIHVETGKEIQYV